MSPLDLHVLGTPPAFVLSQDQTLAFNPFYLYRCPTGKMQTHSELLSLVCVILVLYRFQGSVLSRFGVALASELVYIITVQRKSQHLFATFFAFLRVFFSLRTDPRFHSILVRLIPNVTCHSIVRRSQKRTARTQQTVLHSNLPFRTLTAGENHYCASSIINRLASTSRTNCSVVIAPSSQRSRTYSMTRTPSEVSCSALPLRMYIAGAITFT